MIWLFWFALALVAYAYVGFPLLLWMRARILPKPLATGDVTPSVSVVIAAYNEAASIGQRIENLLSQNYPHDQLEIVVASDGSTDGTHEIVQQYINQGVKLLELPRQGKCKTVTAGAMAARGEVLVFTDANTHFAADAIAQLVRPLADASVGGVAGKQVYLRGETASATADGECLYWNFDQWQKFQQSSAGSVTSATGAIYGIRAQLFQPSPVDAMDDFYISTGVIAHGFRLVYAPLAKAFEPVAEAGGVEFSRKLRIVTQGLRAVIYRRGLLNPFRYGFYAWQLFSHKVLRRLTALPLLVMAILCPFLWHEGQLYQWMLLGEVAVLAAILVSFALQGRKLGCWKPFAAARFFVMVNTAALLSVLSVMRGKRVDRWEPERHAAGTPSATLEAAEGGTG